MENKLILHIEKIRDEISIKYRANIEEINRISKLIIKTKAEIKQNKNILHTAFVYLTYQVDELIQQRNNLLFYNDGLYEAREIVMDYVVRLLKEME